VDCLIFATGFEVGTAYTRQAAFEVFGRDGLSLTEYWGDVNLAVPKDTQRASVTNPPSVRAIPNNTT